MQTPHIDKTTQLEPIGPETAQVATIVDGVIQARHSVRAFLPTDIADDLVREIFRVASRAPSGTNTQPWQVYILKGDFKKGLSDKILQALDKPELLATLREEYDYYPQEWVSPFIDRRRKVGWDMYQLIGIEKGDKPKMAAQHARNFVFFDAPIGIIFTIPRIMGRGSWLDYGMFMQNVMLAAKGRGIDTCAQAAFNQFHRIIAEHLSLPATEMVVCGMAMGYADESNVINTLRTERVPPEQFLHFRTK